MLEITQPSRRLDRLQPAGAPAQQQKHTPRRSGTRFWFLSLAALVYFLAPIRTNLLLLGVDDSPERGALGRTDTMILTTVVPLEPYVGMLSIPRDLWVNVPGVGEQRINTAYFYAEASQPGAGSQAALQTVRENFGVPVHYYAVIHMQGLVAAVDALGGVTLRLAEPIGTLPAGTHELDGLAALAFVRDRSSSDDFSRMQRSQLLIAAAVSKMLNPTNWRALPQLAVALPALVHTNLPFWQWPRLLTAGLRGTLFGVDHRTITREMVTPFQTSAGAQVLAPDWNRIRPLVQEMFGG